MTSLPKTFRQMHLIVATGFQHHLLNLPVHNETSRLIWNRIRTFYFNTINYFCTRRCVFIYEAAASKHKLALRSKMEGFVLVQSTKDLQRVFIPSLRKNQNLCAFAFHVPRNSDFPTITSAIAERSKRQSWSVFINIDWVESKKHLQFILFASK